MRKYRSLSMIVCVGTFMLLLLSLYLHDWFYAAIEGSLMAVMLYSVKVNRNDKKIEFCLNAIGFMVAIHSILTGGYTGRSMGWVLIIGLVIYNLHRSPQTSTQKAKLKNKKS